MKTVGKRSKFLYLIVLGFFAGILFLLFQWITEGNTWVSQPYNGHLYTEGYMTSAGNIVDCNDKVLATSENGQREYASDELTREAVLHTVGDTEGYISTGIQNLYSSELSGYNFFTGLASPTGKSSGNHIQLTIDSELCRAALELLGARKGAVMIYNYKTGETLCKTSSPTYDPENVPADLETNDFYEGVFLDRALSSSFTPGSIFKLVTTACAIENLPDWEAYTTTCNGSVTMNGNEITCLSSHGTIDIAQGLQMSCNVLFAELAVELGAEKMTETAEKMGFNTSLPFEGIDTVKSRYQVAQADEGELAWSGIGQYTDLVNPYHMLVLMGAIANGGKPVMPYVVDTVYSNIGIPLQTGGAKTGNEMLRPATAKILKQLMRNNVQNEYGDELFGDMTVCAKTGTAQVGDGKEDTGWVVGFSADKETPYAFVAVVEEGGFGISSAAPIINELLHLLQEN